MKKVLYILFIVLLIIGLIFCGYKLFGIYEEYKEADDIYENLTAKYTKETKEVIIEEASIDINEDISPIEVDMESLILLNEDVCGWIYIEDTMINYPFVKSHDNEEYLSLTVDKKYSRAGSIFMDCANHDDFSDDNTILYGHNRYSGAMFHAILSYKDQDFYEDHKKVFIYDKEGRAHTYHIISARKVHFTSDDYMTNYGSISSYKQHLNKVCAESDIDTGYLFDASKGIVTLSTCTGHASDYRYVIVLQEE